MDKIKRYYYLRKLIEKYDEYYYNKNESLIDDFTYDKLRKEIEDIEEEYPDLGNYAKGKVGAKLSLDRFKKIKHKYPMTSLKNTYNKEELLEWINNTWYLCEKHNVQCIEKPKITDLYHVEWKFDGLSISLKYDKNGILIQALTRGDGEYGEDVTENIYEIDSVPKKIVYDMNSKLFPAIQEALNRDGWIEVRGEILMSFQEFERINKIREEQCEELYANPRNLASGTLRNLDPTIFKERNLLFAPYHLENLWFNLDYPTFLKEFKKMGFNPIDNISIIFEYPHKEYVESDLDMLFAFINNYILLNKDRINFQGVDIPIDGLVVKTNKYYFDQLKFMGNTTRYPKGAVAYKFEPNIYQTKLLDVTYQIGRTGKITPVAELIPVNIDGSNVSRCTLHNFDEINRLSLKKNCYVDIVKSAAVIPKIIGRSNEVKFDEEIIQIPEFCPVCGSPLVRYKGVDGSMSVDIFCSNEKCPEVIKQQVLYHFNMLKVKGFGPALFDVFNNAFIEHEKRPIESFSEIYPICFVWDDILKIVIKTAGKKTVQNFIDSLKQELSKSIFHRQLASLGIDGIGLQTAKDIESKAKSFNDFLVHYHEYNLPENVINYLNNNINKNGSTIQFTNLLINYLKELQIPFLVNNQQETKKDYVCNVVITGSFDFGSRDQISKFLDDNYIKVQSTINKNTNILICGENGGSKIDKAKELGIITIYPKSYDDLINQIHSAQ